MTTNTTRRGYSRQMEILSVARQVMDSRAAMSMPTADEAFDEWSARYSEFQEHADIRRWSAKDFTDCIRVIEAASSGWEGE